jgi:hypothetical protein
MGRALGVVSGLMDGYFTDTSVGDTWGGGGVIRVAGQSRIRVHNQLLLVRWARWPGCN